MRRETFRFGAAAALALCSTRAMQGAAAQPPLPTATASSSPAWVPYTLYTPIPADRKAAEDVCSATLCYALVIGIGLLSLAAVAVFLYYCCTRRKTRVEFRFSDPEADTSPSIDLSHGGGKVRVLVGGQLGGGPPKDYATNPLAALTDSELRGVLLPTVDVVAESLRDWPNPCWWITAAVDVRGGPLHLPFGVWSCVGAQTAGELINLPTTANLALAPPPKDAPTAWFQLRLQGLAHPVATPTILQPRREAAVSSGSEGEGRPASHTSSLDARSGGSGSESTASTLVPFSLISFRSTGPAADGGGSFVVEGFINRDTSRFVSRKSYTTSTHLEFGVVQCLGDELRLSGRWICLKPEPASGTLVYRVSMPPPMIIMSTVSNASITSPGNCSFAAARGGEGSPQRPLDRIDSPLLAGMGKGEALDGLEI